MKFSIKTSFRIFSLLFIILLVIYFSIRKIWYTALPVSEKHLVYANAPSEINIPERPGVRGILISGPKIDPLFFSIDLSKSGVMSVDWDYLMSVDPGTDVKVNAFIDSKGRLHFDQDDVLMGGHTKAGNYIQQTLRTWRFTPYREGRIQFWFNLPSLGKKMIIDMRQLERKASIPEYIPIYTGKVHFLSNIPTSAIQIQNPE